MSDPFELTVLPPAPTAPGVLADEIVGGAAIQRVGSNYSTAIAVQKPRQLPDVQRRLLEEAQLMGDLAFYGWGAGGNRIEGPSQALAHAAARCWGNCAIEVNLQETSDAWIYTSYFIDLETGCTIARPFRQSKKWTVHGKHDAARKEDIRFQIGASKASRNVILHALPGWLIDKAMSAAKEGVRKKLEAFISSKGIAAAQDLIVKELAKLGVEEAAILAKFSVADRSALDVDRLCILRGDLSALQGGEARGDELFPVEGKAAAVAEIIAGAGKEKAAPTEPAPKTAAVLTPKLRADIEEYADDRGVSMGDLLEPYGCALELVTLEGHAPQDLAKVLCSEVDDLAKGGTNG